jgi:hypothetical protein
MTITESAGTVRAYETELQLGKRFPRWFLSRQGLSFRWRLSSQQGWPSQQGLLPSQQGLCAHMEQSISWGSGFVDNFQGGSDSVFGDDYRVTRDCAHRQFHASAGEEVLVMIFELEETHCRWRFLSKLGLFVQINPDVCCGGSLVDYYYYFFFIKCKCIKDQKIYIAGKPASSDTGWTEREHAPLETETTTTKWKNLLKQTMVMRGTKN